MLRYECVILDCHGLITHHIHRAYAAFFKAWFAHTGNRPPKELTLMILNRGPEQSVVERATELAKAQNLDEVSAQALGKLVRRYYDEVYVPNWNVRGTIRQLSNLGLKIVVLSNGNLHQVEPLMQRWNLLNYISAVFARENTPLSVKDSPKPYIDVVQSILKPVGIQVNSPSRCLIVGDHWVDMVTANNNGMHGAFLIVAGTQRMPPEVVIDRKVYTNHTPTYPILEPMELVKIVMGNDLDREQRLRDFSTIGLSTKTTRVRL